MNKQDTYDIQLNSPMGWIKVIATLTETSETEFDGSVKLLGLTVPMTNCHKSGAVYSFSAAPKLPFGVLDVQITANVDNNGNVTGVATAPRHRPMEVKGQRRSDTCPKLLFYTII